MNESALFMQVRLSSSRLPEKALLPLEGKTVIAHAMEALRELPVSRYVLLTDAVSAPRLSTEAARYDFEVFAGEPEDVLKRYCDAILHYQVDQVVRATGDNPLVSCSSAREAMQLQESLNADYAGISGTPYGTGVEVVKARALLDLAAYTTDPYEREHVTPGLYRRRDRYTVVIRPAAAQLHMPDLRVTLDTPADYDYIAEVYRELYRGRPVEIPELIAYGQRHLQHSA